MKKSVLLLFFAGCVATGIFGIGRKIPMNRVNDLGQREGYWRDSFSDEPNLITLKLIGEKGVGSCMDDYLSISPESI